MVLSTPVQSKADDILSGCCLEGLLGLRVNLLRKRAAPKPTIRSMNRSELVEKLAERFAQLHVRDAQASVDAIVDALTMALTKGVRIEIRGFGSFTSSQRTPRLARNPRTGDSVVVPSKRVVRFKPGGDLRDGVNRSSR